MVGVGFASALAGQASRHTRKFFERGGNPLQPAFWDPIDVEDALLDSVLGIFIFKVCSIALSVHGSHEVFRHVSRLHLQLLLLAP